MPKPATNTEDWELIPAESSASDPHSPVVEYDTPVPVDDEWDLVASDPRESASPIRGGLDVSASGLSKNLYGVVGLIDRILITPALKEARKLGNMISGAMPEDAGPEVMPAQFDEQGNPKTQEQLDADLAAGREKYDPTVHAKRWTEQMQGKIDNRIDRILNSTPSGRSYAAHMRAMENATFRLAEGDPKAMYSVVTDPGAWGAAVAAAVPSLAVMVATGGNTAVIGLMEAMEAAETAEDLERELGVEVEPWQFASMVATVGTINAALERTGFESLFKNKVGKGTGSLFSQLLKGQFVEGATEGAQGRITNMAAELLTTGQITEERALEGVTAEVMGGVGAGNIRGARHVMQGGEILPQWSRDTISKLRGKEKPAEMSDSDAEMFQAATDAEKVHTWFRDMENRGVDPGETVPTETGVDQFGNTQTLAPELGYTETPGPGYTTGGGFGGEAMPTGEEGVSPKGRPVLEMSPEGGITHRVQAVDLGTPGMMGTTQQSPAEPIQFDDSIKIITDGIAEVRQLLEGTDPATAQAEADTEAGEAAGFGEEANRDRIVGEKIARSAEVGRNGLLGGDDSETRLPGSENQGTPFQEPTPPIQGTYPPIGGNDGEVLLPQAEDQGAPNVDEGANLAATSPENDLPEPTDAQKGAGNYKVGRIKLGNLEISVENPAGSERSGTSEQGKDWSQTLQDHYGYIRKTDGADGDQLDAFVRPGSTFDTIQDQPLFVVDQVNPETGEFDEHKIVIGYDTEAEAREAYQRNYEDGWQGLGAITELTPEQAKQWMAGDTTAPLSSEIKTKAKTQATALESAVERKASGRERFEKGRQVKPEKDSLSTAIAKLGGISKAEAGQHFPNREDKNKRWGFLPVFSQGGVEFDYMAERLQAQGYPIEDGADLVNKLSEEMRSGEPVLTPEGQEKAAERELRQRETERTAQDEVEPESIEAETGMTLDEFDAVVDNLEPVASMMPESEYTDDMDVAGRRIYELGSVLDDIGGDSETVLAKEGMTDDQAITELEKAIARQRTSQRGQEEAEAEPGERTQAAVDRGQVQATEAAATEDVEGVRAALDEAVKREDQAAQAAPDQSDGELVGELLEYLGRHWNVAVPTDALTPVAPDSTTKPLADAVGELFQKRVVMVDQATDLPTAFDGVVMRKARPDVIFVNAETKSPHLVVMGHELTHTMRVDEPEIYADFEAAMRALTPQFPDWARKYQKRLEKEGEVMGMNEIYEEYLAEFVGDRFVDPQFWDAIAQEMEPTSFQRLVNFITRLVNRLTQSWRGVEIGQDMVSDLETGRALAADAMQRYINRGEASGPASTTDTDIVFAPPEAAPEAATGPAKAPQGRRAVAEIAPNEETRAAIERHGLPADTVFEEGNLLITKGRKRAAAGGEESNWKDSIDEAATELREHLDWAVRRDTDKAQRTEAAKKTADKLRAGETPTAADWRASGIDVRNTDRYVYQEVISPFLREHFGFGRVLKGKLGKAHGKLRSDMGGERPIVYLNRLPGVLATKPDTTPVVEPETASSEAAPEAPTKPLSEIWRSEIVEVEDTGEQVTLSENAETLGGRLAKRMSNLEKLMECLKA